MEYNLYVNRVVTETARYRISSEAKARLDAGEDVVDILATLSEDDCQVQSELVDSFTIEAA